MVTDQNREKWLLTEEEQGLLANKLSSGCRSYLLVEEALPAQHTKTLEWAQERGWKTSEEVKELVHRASWLKEKEVLITLSQHLEQARTEAIKEEKKRIVGLFDEARRDVDNILLLLRCYQDIIDQLKTSIPPKEDWLLLDDELVAAVWKQSGRWDEGVVACYKKVCAAQHAKTLTWAQQNGWKESIEIERDIFNAVFEAEVAEGIKWQDKVQQAVIADRKRIIAELSQPCSEKHVELHTDYDDVGSHDIKQVTWAEAKLPTPARWFCRACMSSFVAKLTGKTPEEKRE